MCLLAVNLEVLPLPGGDFRRLGITVAFHLDVLTSLNFLEARPACCIIECVPLAGAIHTGLRRLEETVLMFAVEHVVQYVDVGELLYCDLV